MSANTKTTKPERDLSEGYANIPYMVLGGVLQYLDSQVAYCQAQGRATTDLSLAMFFFESASAYFLFKTQVIEMFNASREKSPADVSRMDAPHK